MAAYEDAYKESGAVRGRVAGLGGPPRRPRPHRTACRFLRHHPHIPAARSPPPLSRSPTTRCTGVKRTGLWWRLWCTRVRFRLGRVHRSGGWMIIGRSRSGVQRQEDLSKKPTGILRPKAEVCSMLPSAGALFRRQS
jgi:hypothetical protein